MVEAEMTARCGVCGNTVASNMVVQLGGKTVCMSCKPGFAREMAGARPVGEVRFAGFWVRFAAHFIDSLVLFIPNMLVGFALGASRLTLGTGRAMYEEPEYDFLPTIVSLAILILYDGFFHGKYGATPGKMAVRVKVVQPDGRPIGYGQAFGRAFGWILSLLTCTIGFIMAGIDSQKRALHDRICDTRVVYK